MKLFELSKLVKVKLCDDFDNEIGVSYELRDPKTGLKLVEAKSLKKLKQRCEAIETLLGSNHAGGN